MSLSRIFVLISLFAISTAVLAAPGAEPASTAATISVASAVVMAPPKSNSPADIAAATQAYIDRLDAGALARSDSYFEGGYWLQLWNYLFGLALAWWFLSGGISVWMRNQAEKFTHIKTVHVVLYTLQYVVLTALIGLPLNWYQGYYREHEYGLSNLGLMAWFGEQGKGLLVGLIAASILLVIVYAVIRKARKTWAIWGSVVGVIFLAVMLMVGPVFIAPIFNDYQPLENGQLKAEILSMARANGVPADNVYQFDASKQSKRISANVSGLMGTTRISLNDNLLNRSSAATIKAVMGHEMGHYVLNHGPKMLLSFGLVLVLGFVFVKWGFRRFNRPQWGVRDETDIAGLPLLAILFSTYFFVMTPVTNSIVRANENEADLYGLNASGEPEGFSEGILSLSEYRKMKPGYWEEILFYDHPSGYHRIYASMRWRAEHLPSVKVSTVKPATAEK